MELNNAASVREIFAQMSTEQLRAILDKELHAENADSNAIRLILELLRERKQDEPVEITPKTQEAWETYQRKSAAIWKASKRKGKVSRFLFRTGLMAASLVLVLTVLMVAVIPKQAEADSLWDRLARLTTDIVEFFSPDDTQSRIYNYEFVPQHPDLQEVYDTVKAIGGADGSVPMWMPETQKLAECVIKDAWSKDYVYASFTDGNYKIIYQANVYEEEVAHNYFTEEGKIIQKEIDGTTFTIIWNAEMWIVTWVNKNTECSIATDCQENVVYDILDSIYVVEAH